MADAAGIYLLWKPTGQPGSGYVLVQQRRDFMLATPGGELDSGSGPTNDYGNAFTAAIRELYEESGIDLRADQLRAFTWLGSYGGPRSDEKVFFTRAWNGPSPPRAAAPGSDMGTETLAYPFGRSGFTVGDTANTTENLTTNHAWVSLDQLLNEFVQIPVPQAGGGTRMMYRSTQVSPITDKTISYTPYVRTNFEMLRDFSQQGASAYRPYNWIPRQQNPLVRLAPGAPYVPAARRPLSVGQQRVAQVISTKQNQKIVTQVILELMKVIAALTAGSAAAAIAANAITELHVLAGISTLAPPPEPGTATTTTKENVPVWAADYFNESELTQRCKEAKFIGADCVPRAAYDIILALNEHITTGQLETSHAANLADYQALDAEIKRLKAADVPAPADVVEKKQLDFDKRYRNVSVPVVDPTKPGPATRVLRIPNPYRAHEYRQGIASFANPVLPGNKDLTANIDILKTVAPKEFIADNRAAKLLLEDLWFCARNPGGPGCFLAEGLVQLEQYKASKVSADGAARARKIMKGPATDLGTWLKILKQTATATA